MEIADLLGFGQLGAFLAIVLMFLKHIEKKDEDTTIIHKECEVRITAVAAESKKLAEKCLTAFLENTKAVADFRHAIEKLEAKINHE